MSRESIARGWLSAEEAGRYVGISPEHIRRAIQRHQLRAYVKPVTRSSEGKHVFYKIAPCDIDEWIRDCWEEA